MESPAVQIVLEGNEVMVAAELDSVIVVLHVVIIPQEVIFTVYVPGDLIV